MQAAYLMYVFQFNHFYSFNIWSFIDLETVLQIIIKNINDSFKTLSINSESKTVKEIACLLMYYNIIWHWDVKNVSILKDIVLPANRNAIVLQTCDKKLKKSNACVQCFDEHNSFMCCVVDNFVSLSLDLDICVNC